MSGNWIFQVQPKRFHIDIFLDRQPKSTSWLASQHAEAIGIGDRVFLWRSIGGGLRDESGIFAEARVTAKAALLPPPADEQELWVEDADRKALANRVRIEFRRIGNQHNLLRRRFLEDDPILGDLSIFDRPRQTNYPISIQQADRIAVLWHGLGSPWSPNELIGALWLATLRLQGSGRVAADPIAEFALRSGRSVTNVRATAETRMTSGFPGSKQTFGNAPERAVWDRFFDSDQRSLDLTKLNHAYLSLWTAGRMPTITLDGNIAFPSMPDLTEATSDETELLEDDLANLFRAHYDGHASDDPAPHREDPSQPAPGQDTRPERKQIVVAIAKVRAQFCCELPGCTIALFTGIDGRPFVEVHHIVPLSEGGPDKPENVAALCPAHHREAHHGMRRVGVQADLQMLRRASLPGAAR
jgi:hypothetical protein